MKSDPNGPAFPISWDNYSPDHDQSGLTKREWMATKFLVAASEHFTSTQDKEAVTWALRRTDALLAALNKTEEAKDAT